MTEFDFEVPLQSTVEAMEFLDNFIVEVGTTSIYDAPTLKHIAEFERCIAYRSTLGGGAYYISLLEETKSTLRIEFENGAQWQINLSPFWRKFIHYPIATLQQVADMTMPNPKDERRYDQVRENIVFFKSKGFFTSAEICGFFSDLWYRYVDFKTLMIGMIKQKSLVKELIAKVAKFNLEVAEEFLKRGVDSILFPDDLGFKVGSFFSKEFYKEFFFPWHKEIADLCHSFGAYAHMHSHGNINEILPLIVETGIDILDPIGPSDHMDLKHLKQEFGDKLTFFGGLSNEINEMSEETMVQHLKNVINTGKKGGGFMLRIEGGISSKMPRDMFSKFLQYCRDIRGS